MVAPATGDRSPWGFGAAMPQGQTSKQQPRQAMLVKQYAIIGREQSYYFRIVAVLCTLLSEEPMTYPPTCSTCFARSPWRDHYLYFVGNRWYCEYLLSAKLQRTLLCGKQETLTDLLSIEDCKGCRHLLLTYLRFIRGNLTARN